ncbi:hypothetical protein PR002_g14027 [Phytophthora rubi]|uniref:Uncharacterized protein n=1 Tax=Phytophthora rubi TaxID=129364 RepID=A0A6A3L8U3_9STRA|nr:hypothetical protein PF003_g14060 [Phytophthora fragariae]KAE9015100.1 hypothetical protein PR002_g14027 [Phytophthora rubi]
MAATLARMAMDSGTSRQLSLEGNQGLEQQWTQVTGHMAEDLSPWMATMDDTTQAVVVAACL